MRTYNYIGYFNDNADIKDIMGNNAWDNPNALAKYLEDGYGKFYHSDGEECMTISDVNNKDIFISDDLKYIVKYSEGSFIALDEDDHYSVNAGFFVDVWKLDDSEVDLSTPALRELSDQRHREDMRIKSAIKDEFKARFTKPGEGLDFFSNCGNAVGGMLDETGDIGKMFLNADGEIQVVLVQEYDDPVEDFESRYFACDNWPQLLINVRDGIEKGWLIEEEV